MDKYPQISVGVNIAVQLLPFRAFWHHGLYEGGTFVYNKNSFFMVPNPITAKDFLCV